MKEEGNTNGASECHKFLSKKIFNLLDSGGDDDSEDEQPEKTVKQIVTDEERDKVDVPRCEDFIDDFAISIFCSASGKFVVEYPNTSSIPLIPIKHLSALRLRIFILVRYPSRLL